ncbi:MAG: DUF2155 domain-containing protein [Aestuariivita sp.]|nr:DUF2155 domain-containing protein [Aestuariivita sp.]MCY4345535.1 DUF2155 domain-containing protein [Aestuariivita sp.]
MIWLLTFVIVFGGAIASRAQEIDVTPLPPVEVPDSTTESSPPRQTPERALGTNGSGAVLRALDKVSGETVDVAINVGQQAQVFELSVNLSQCRYPVDNESGDAFAYLVIQDRDEEKFAGWMIASSPALNALDHARYDIWVLRCTTS